MANDLVSPDDLTGFPGAPFTEAQVDAAVADVRAAAGWHIAPVREGETVTLDVERCESWLRLPTRHLVSVDEIRDASDDSVIDASTYGVSKSLAQVKRTGLRYWPSGYGAVEADMTHGYESCPPDVMRAVVSAIAMAKRDPTVKTVSIDDFSVTRNTDAIQSAVKVELGSGYVLEDSIYGIGIA